MTIHIIGTLKQYQMTAWVQHHELRTWHDPEHRSTVIRRREQILFTDEQQRLDAVEGRKGVTSIVLL